MNTGEPPRITDQDIHAYGDGQIDPGTEHARAVEAHLAADTEARARLQAYRKQDEAIRARYRHVLAQPVPEHLRPAALRAAGKGPVHQRVPLRMAAGVVLVGCAALLGWLAGQPSPGSLERFADRTSAYLAEQSETNETIALDSTPALQSLSVLGAAPDFEPEGLELVDTRQVDNGDMYEARYRDGVGRELRLFVAPDPQRHDNLLSRTERDGRKVVYWTQGPLMYGLTGDFNEHILDDFAHTAIRQFRDRLETRSFAQTGRDTASSPAGDTSESTPPVTSALPKADEIDPEASKLNSDTGNIH